MLLVTEGKGKINQLGYNKRTHEYVYFHKGVEIWREKGNEELLDYFNEIRRRRTELLEKVDGNS